MLPPNMPEPRGLEVQVNCFVDADHAGNHITQRSHTGILIFINRSPIVWYSKSQTTVESSTFGAEFVATRIAVILSNPSAINFACLGFPLEDQQICLLIKVLWCLMQLYPLPL